jgi:hypothetical protein
MRAGSATAQERLGLPLHRMQHRRVHLRPLRRRQVQLRKRRIMEHGRRLRAKEKKRKRKKKKKKKKEE